MLSYPINEQKSTNFKKHLGRYYVLYSYCSVQACSTAVHHYRSIMSTIHGEEARVLVLYTGGTIGMKCIDGVYRPEANYLLRAMRNMPLLNDCDYVSTNYADAKTKPYCLPSLQHSKKRLVYWVVEYDPLLDSSDMSFDDWIKIGKDIQEAYDQYVGFVILHGTDTLAYTACALSFMLENVGKPVVITGAQVRQSSINFSMIQ
ncbi:unnamed protein product [Brugia timori]|uniref:Asparaginase domain-containing protein n=1 Tax=Brugia timori TaxID=42155 RepID=A0A0R3Q3P6_9BILA|nr:unnamed protein product [Brugia timori]